MTVKPLREVQHPSRASTVDRARSGKSFAESPEPVENHSWHRAAASKHYHKQVVDGKQATGQYGDRKIAELNPNSAVPGVRSFPGLANG